MGARDVPRVLGSWSWATKLALEQDRKALVGLALAESALARPAHVGTLLLQRTG